MGDRWIVETELGVWYSIDLVGMTVMRLPLRGGVPVPGEGWVDERSIDLLAVPAPWLPVVGEPLRLLVAIEPGSVTARTTTRVVGVTESDD